MEFQRKRKAIILFADDDDDDHLLIKEAFNEIDIPTDEIYFAENGADLLDYLRRKGKYSSGGDPAPRPDIIILDLNMPKMDGFTALREIKVDPELRQIAVIILTTSKEHEDIIRCYELGANSFLVKPQTFSELVRVADAFSHYWMRVSVLPKQAP